MIKVRVKPNAGKQEIEKISDEEYRVSLKSFAQDNKANVELLKLMKKYLKKNFRIVTGFKSKDKLIDFI